MAFSGLKSLGYEMVAPQVNLTYVVVGKLIRDYGWLEPSDCAGNYVTGVSTEARHPTLSLHKDN